MANSNRGFASMDDDKQREIASKGGKASGGGQGETGQQGGGGGGGQGETGHQGGGTSKGTSNRGFASMDPQKQREIASKGGKAAHQQGVAHEFTSEEAREAGRKGGETVARDRSHMSEIGKKGAEARNENR